VAHARGFRGPVRGQIRSKRMTTWGLGPEEVNGAFSASGSQGWSSGTSLTTEAKVTITRIRGIFHVFLTAATAAGDGFSGAAGLCLVSATAFGAGDGSVPTPITDISYPWIWHQFFDIRALTTTFADGVNAPSASFRTMIDSKAMRIQGSEQILMGVTEVTEAGTAVMEVQADTRILDKLS